ncbi:hypothetical protein [Labedaea rhizosphaerae]|uniref:DUF8017 domain-containing protein n=1 Tax=Labedaea rhizosphaerae TaxID=598644 RepID=A0A4R6SDX3_LABRH|nr:hypothetical protein [Labedaea rhizosphaerae]TDP97315.1 hypothetical protein EV186_103279 [Labedaea rhizosphaerae]
MSTPGGYGGYGQDPNQQYDPLTGQPLPHPGHPAPDSGGFPNPAQTAAYPTGPDTGGYQGLGQYPQGQYPQGQYPQTSAFPNNFPTGGFQQLPPPKPKRTGLIVGIIAAVVVVAVGATLAVVLLNKKGDDQAGGGNPTTTTTTTSAPHTSASSGTLTAPPSSGGSNTPQVPGWQTVSVPNEHVQFDVPPDWKIESGSNTTVTIPNSRAVMEGVATFKTGACPGSPTSFRAKIGVGPESSDDPAKAAKAVATTWANGLAAAYGGKTAVPTSSPQKVNNARTDATLAVVRITTKKDSCNPPAMLVAVVSFKSGSGTESVILFGDQEVPDAITTDLAAQVLVTARPTQ